MKKLLVSMGATLSVVAPVATVVACGATTGSSVLTIKDALDKANNEKVRVQAVVLKINGTNGRTLIDQSGSTIDIYDNSYSDPESGKPSWEDMGGVGVGTFVDITGTRSEYNGTKQIGNITKLEVIDTPSIELAHGSVAQYIEKQNGGLIDRVGVNFNLPKTIFGQEITSYTSSDEAIATISGEATDAGWLVSITRHASENKELKITANIGELSADLTFNVLNQTEDVFTYHTISELRDIADGTPAKIKGILTSDTLSSRRLNINDGSGALQTYDNNPDGITLPDSVNEVEKGEATKGMGVWVEIKGIVATHNGKKQLKDLNAVTILDKSADPDLQAMAKGFIEDELAKLEGMVYLGDFELPSKVYGSLDVSYSTAAEGVTIATDGKVTVDNTVTDAKEIDVTASFEGETKDIKITVQYSSEKIYDLSTSNRTWTEANFTKGSTSAYFDGLGGIKLGSSSNFGAIYSTFESTFTTMKLEAVAWNGKPSKVALLKLDSNGNVVEGSAVISEEIAADALVAGNSTSRPDGLVTHEYTITLDAEYTGRWALTSDTSITGATQGNHRVILYKATIS